MLRAAVVFTSAMTATLFKRQTKAVEAENSRALSKMTSVASQAFRCDLSLQEPQMQVRPLAALLMRTFHRRTGKLTGQQSEQAMLNASCGHPTMSPGSSCC